jgi:hypothetical protein
VGTTARNQQQDDTELVGSRVARIDPNTVTDQSGGTLNNDDDAVEATDEMSQQELVDDRDEIVANEGDSIRGNDHHQDND